MRHQWSFWGRIAEVAMQHCRTNSRRLASLIFFSDSRPVGNLRTKNRDSVLLVWQVFGHGSGDAPPTVVLSQDCGSGNAALLTEFLQAGKGPPDPDTSDGRWHWRNLPAEICTWCGYKPKVPASMSLSTYHWDVLKINLINQLIIKFIFKTSHYTHRNLIITNY